MYICHHLRPYFQLDPLNRNSAITLQHYRNLTPFDPFTDSPDTSPTLRDQTQYSTELEVGYVCLSLDPVSSKTLFKALAISRDSLSAAFTGECPLVIEVWIKSLSN